MTWYNLTEFTNLNSTATQLTWINSELTNGWFGILIVVALFIIVFVTMANYDFAGAFLGASFLTLIVSILLFMNGWIPMYVLVVTLLLPVIGILMVKLLES